MRVMNSILFGDCRATMRGLIAEGVKAQMCVTSPPYFGLRDYGVDGQLGVEATPDEYVENMADTFDLVKAMLHDDGVLFLNIGDSHYNYRVGHAGGMPGQGFHNGKQNGKPTKEVGCARRATKLTGIQEKELIGIPWMLAFALRARGWLIRQEIIWSKPNPTPEKVTDRFTRSHEQVFLLTKRPFYKFDALQTLEPGVDGKPRRKRSVWEVPTSRAPGAHFATFPLELIRPCIRAGSQPGDVVLDPFVGSGTTAVVAEQEGRRWIGCEINSGYAPIQQARQRALYASLATDPRQRALAQGLEREIDR
jgi:DNA modification methylase